MFQIETKIPICFKDCGERQGNFLGIFCGFVISMLWGCMNCVELPSQPSRRSAAAELNLADWNVQKVLVPCEYRANKNKDLYWKEKKENDFINR